MIYGIGTDIVEVSRIADALTRFGDVFAKHILTENEYHEFELSRIKARFLAKRFAAKEAFGKALGTGLRVPVAMQNIGIGHNDLGKPVIVLAPELQTWVNQRSIKHMHLSISDEKALAVAFVVLES
ncbi:MAG: holo-ACP synthase [Methylobacillus sp.]|jgi:holo-[acyl-carrier protein] synthase|nr:holo-ACP synthase [Methylobacillus sp.]